MTFILAKIHNHHNIVLNSTFQPLVCVFVLVKDACQLQHRNNSYNHYLLWNDSSSLEHQHRVQQVRQSLLQRRRLLQQLRMRFFIITMIQYTFICILARHQQQRQLRMYISIDFLPFYFNYTRRMSRTCLICVFMKPITH